jgi:hypothetical protein
MRIVMIVMAMLALVACQHREPAIEVREVPVPTPVRCVDPADIPPEPPQVGDQFNGDAKHDLGVLAPNALELRAWGRSLRALIVPACTTDIASD